MRHRTVPMLGIALCVAGAVIAQEIRTQPEDRAATTQPRQERTALRPTSENQAGNSLDGPIAACLLLGNHEEVALAKFAEPRIEHAQVKQFAQKMAQGHQQAISQLEKYAPQNVSLTLDGQGQPGTNQPRTTVEQPRRTNATPAEGDMQQQMFAMQKAIAQECLALTQRELSEKEGPEFDKCFMGQQISAHIAMMAKLTGSEQFASADLQQVVEQQRQTAEKHLQMAKQIMKQLESESQATARETTRTPGQ